MRLRSAPVLFFVIAGCSRTVAAAHPSSAEYAEHEVAPVYKADVRTVLAARDDEASRSALTCVLLFAYRSAMRDDGLARIKARSPISPASDAARTCG